MVFKWSLGLLPLEIKHCEVPLQKAWKTRLPLEILRVRWDRLPRRIHESWGNKDSSQCWGEHQEDSGRCTRSKEMEKSFPPWRAVKAMESTGRRNVCVRGRISACRVGAGGQDRSPGAWSQGGTRDGLRQMGGHHSVKGRAQTCIRSAAGGMLSELCWGHTSGLWHIQSGCCACLLPHQSVGCL